MPWHLVLFFVGITNLVWAMLNVQGIALSFEGSGIVYGSCVLATCLAGRRFRINGHQSAPFESAALCSVGFLITQAHQAVTAEPFAVSAESVAAPSAAFLVMIDLIWVTGRLADRFPAPSRF